MSFASTLSHPRVIFVDSSFSATATFSLPSLLFTTSLLLLFIFIRTSWSASLPLFTSSLLLVSHAVSSGVCLLSGYTIRSGSHGHRLLLSSLSATRKFDNSHFGSCDFSLNLLWYPSQVLAWSKQSSASSCTHLGVLHGHSTVPYFSMLSFLLLVAHCNRPSL